MLDQFKQQKPAQLRIKSGETTKYLSAFSSILDLIRYGTDVNDEALLCAVVTPCITIIYTINYSICIM